VKIHDRLPILVTHGLCHLLGYHHSDEHNWQLVSITLMRMFMFVMQTIIGLFASMSVFCVCVSRLILLVY